MSDRDIEETIKMFSTGSLPPLDVSRQDAASSGGSFGLRDVLYEG